MSDETPKVFVSYSHDSPEHRERVRALAERLRDDGIDCRLDLWNDAPAQGWPAWMEQEMEAADFVLVVSTAGYLARSRVVSGGSGGRGVRFESVLLTQDLYHAGMWNERFIPVLLANATPQDILRPLRSYSYYRADNDAGYEKLYRRLTGQPEHIAPEIGPQRVLPPRGRAAPAQAPSKAEPPSTTDEEPDPLPTENPQEASAAAENEAPSDEKPPRRSLRSRLEFAGIVLGVIVALLTILSSVLDLPSKWRAFWNNGEKPPEEIVVQEEQKTTSYELRLTHALDGSPLAGVEVTIPELALSATSDEHGVVRFPELPVEPESMLRLRASSTGFEAREREVTVGLEGMDQWRMKPVDR